MVGDDVHHDADSQGPGVPDERVELVEIAVRGLDVEVVGDVVPVIGLRRWVARVEPDRVDAEIGEVRQAAADAGEIADAVVVRVGERPHVQLVDDRRLPPCECAVDVLLLSGAWNAQITIGCAVTTRAAGPRRPRRRAGRPAHDQLQRQLLDERDRPDPGGERTVRISEPRWPDISSG
jgi:hypothetical protein